MVFVVCALFEARGLSVVCAAFARELLATSCAGRLPPARELLCAEAPFSAYVLFSVCAFIFLLVYLVLPCDALCCCG